MHGDTQPQTANDQDAPDRRPKSTPHSLVEPDASKYIGYSVAWLRQRRCRHDGGPAYIKCGRSIRYRIVDLDAYLAAHRVEPREPAETA
jgi:hypothetical protein